MVAGRLGGRCDIPAWKPFGFSVKPIGVALAKYCDKFVVGQLQITFGGIVEDFFIDTLRFLVGEAVAFVGDWIRHKYVKQFQSTDNKKKGLEGQNRLIVVTSDKEGRTIKGFGSGFFFQYRDRLFLVTADHVSHPDDFEAGIRLGKDDYVWVFNNKNSTTELATLLTPVGGLFSFDRSDITDELSLFIPDMKDISFAILPNSFKYPFLTHELRVEEQIIVPAGEEKVIISSQCATELKDTDYCLIEGCVQWVINLSFSISYTYNS